MAAWYLVVALAVLYPLLRDGYLLLLDWTPAPLVRWHVEGPMGVQEAPIRALLVGLNTFLPGWLIQRAILIGILWVAGMAAHVTAPVRGQAARFFAGTLYALTPFVFSRLMAGHWRLLIAYALAPFVVRAVLRLTEAPESGRGIRAGLWIAGVAAVSPHALLLLLPLAIGAVTAICFGSSVRRVAKSFGLSLLVVAVGTLWWIVPAALNGIPGASQEALATFASKPALGASLPLTLFSLRGFWIPELDAAAVPGWDVLTIALVGLTLVGMVAIARSSRPRWTAVMLATTVAALVLALGTANQVTEPVARALYEWVPGFSALREPHKALLLLALAYAWFGAAGMDWLASRSRPVLRGVAVVALVIPLSYMPQMLGALGDRLKPVDYPASWYAADTVLRTDPDRFSTLVLPWQLYLPLPFNHSPRPVANPAGDFFSVPIVSSQDPQIGPDEAREGSAASRIRSLVVRHAEIDRLGAEVARMGIKYVLFIPGNEGEGYAFLSRQEDLAPVLRSPDLILFRNTAWPAHRTRTDGVRPPVGLGNEGSNTDRTWE